MTEWEGDPACTPLNLREAGQVFQRTLADRQSRSLTQPPTQASGRNRHPVGTSRLPIFNSA